jgi:acyl transferase domain-containing protein/NADPH:quinone reductase-like Zn-dependent oxidoreductase/surfactin synthase thioesterase subunit/acyl carrier protein
MAEPIAIIGFACRFPGAPDAEAYWRLLCEAQSGVGQARPCWDADAAMEEAGGVVRQIDIGRGGFLPEPDLFDPHAFGISAREALEMDPQQRLLLEIAQEAMEDAGLRTDVPNDTGVFVGIAGTDYSFLKLNRPKHLAEINAFTGTGNTHSISANRISYVFDLKGPSLAIDTACSSSLVAIHAAMRSLLDGDCATALAGGVNLIMSPDVSTAFARASMLSATGQCWTFDARADGYVRGEGCGLLVLKRLSDAQRDGDRIVALLHGSAVNQDGRTRGITLPDADAQEKVLRAALGNGGLEPEAIDFVEAHGTGTPIGDPIEVEALARVFGAESGRSRELLIGSVKANIGHLETASGIAGLIKVVLALRNGRIPPQPNFSRANPNCRLGASGIAVASEEHAWPRARRPRFAGVSAFGFGGTNAHVVLGEPPEAPSTGPSDPDEWRVATVSTRNREALSGAARTLAGHLRTQFLPLADVARTTTEGRAHHIYRRAFVAADTESLVEALDKSTRAEPPARILRPPRIAFLFTGQGSQYVGMGRTLFERDPDFRSDLEQCDALHRAAAGRSLLDIMFQGESEIDRTEFAQPALFSLGYALARTWRRWGIAPQACFGHSVGEFAAACDSGIMALEDAMRLIIRRGQLMQALPAGGAMLSLAADPAQAQALLDSCPGALSIAALNGPQSTTISGEAVAIDRVAEKAAERKLAAVRLSVSHAFHSPLMDPMLAELGEAAAEARIRAGEIPLISCRTGRVCEPDELADPQYWRRQAREPVRFADGLDTLARLGADVFIEIGPRPVLCGLARSVLGRDQKRLLLPSLSRGEDEVRTMLASLARVYERGADVAWEQVNRGRGRKISLPPTPFVRESHWLAPAEGQPTSPSIRAEGASSSPYVVVEQTLPAGGGGYADHRIDGRPLFPAAGMLSLCLAAIERAGLPAGSIVRNLSVHLPVELSNAVLLHAHVREQAGVPLVELFARHAQGEATPRNWALAASASVPPLRHLAGSMPETLPAGCTSWPQVNVGVFYAALAAQGLEYGTLFRPVSTIRSGGRGRGAVAELSTAQLPEDADCELRRAVLLDGAMQALAAAGGVEALAGSGGNRYLPVGIDAAFLTGDLRGRFRAFAKLREEAHEGAPFITGDMRLFDETGAACGALLGISLRQVAAAAQPPALQARLKRIWREVEAEGEVRASGQPPRIVAPSDEAGDMTVRCRAFPGVQPIAELLKGDATSEPPCLVLEELPSWAAETSAAVRIARTCRYALQLVETFERHAPRSRLVIITRAAAATGESELADPEQAAIAAFLVGVAQERPSTAITVADLPKDAALEIAEFERLCRLQSAEPMVAWRDGRVLVPRLVEDGAINTRATAPAGVVRLAPSQIGRLDTLELRPADAVEPGPGEVRIAVAAAALNFRDVLKVLGAYPGMTGLQLGDECSGTVVAVGEGCTRFSPGDAVVAMTAGAFASEVVAPEAFVVALPSRLDWAEGAAFPVAFSTAYRALVEIANLQAGERVLIHAAAGGVGLAAVEIARALGAEVYATVGSEAKRELLRERGVERLFDSRSAEFAGDILAATGGEGVDVVLNSLAGPLLALSTMLLAPFGRFVEIGKRDIFANTPVGLAAFKENQSFAAVDMEALMRLRPEQGTAILRRVAAEIDAGRWSPLPVVRYPAIQAGEAFRLMSKGAHRGKITLAFQSSERPGGTRGEAGTHLITGAFGSLGLMLARWAAKREPEVLLLCGRNPPPPAAERVIAELRSSGVRVETRTLDIGDPEAVGALLAETGDALPPLRGVYHLAGRLADGLTATMDDERLLAPMHPKIDGAALLDRLTRRSGIERFVLFSSLAGQISPPGQANYAAANAYLDALAAQRRAAGLPALSIAWGPWAGEGMAARAGGGQGRLALFEPIEPERAFAVLDHLLIEETAHAVVASPQIGLIRNIQRDLVPQALRDWTDAGGDRAAADRTGARMTPEDVAQAILREIALVLDLEPGEIDRTLSLDELGMDSLMALELTHRLEIGYGVAFPRELTGRAPTADDIIRIATSVGGDAAPALPPGPKPEAAPLAQAEAGMPAPSPIIAPHEKVRVRRLARSGQAAGSARRGRLICFPWAGGRAASFGGWEQGLPGVELFAAELLAPTPSAGPGDVQDRAAMLAPLVAPLIEPGTLLFGHSLGALVAFETARLLRGPLAEAGAKLLVSGRNAPQLAGAGEDPTLLDDEGLVDYLLRLGGTPAEVIAQKELLQQGLPSLRRDLSLARNYGFVEGPPLTGRLIVAYGRADPHVTAAGMAAWQEVAVPPIQLVPFDGGHFYFRDDPRAFWSLLTSALDDHAVASDAW